jgi:hypothetical protein
VVRRVHFCLLRYPEGLGIRRYVEAGDPSSVMAKDEKAEEDSEGHGGHRQEGDRGDVHDVVPREGAPGLRRWLLGFPHVLRYSRLRDLEAEQAKLELDSLRSPGRILPAQPADQIAYLAVHLRAIHAAPCGLPAPKEPKASSVPAQQVRGLTITSAEAQAVQSDVSASVNESGAPAGYPLPWAQQKNLASQILALNVRRLSADWERTYSHPVYLAETFVDAARFREEPVTERATGCFWARLAAGGGVERATSIMGTESWFSCIPLRGMPWTS